MNIEKSSRVRNIYTDKVYTVEEVTYASGIVFVLVSPDGEKSRWCRNQYLECFVDEVTLEE